MNGTVRNMQGLECQDDVGGRKAEEQGEHNWKVATGRTMVVPDVGGRKAEDNWRRMRNNWSQGKFMAIIAW